MKKTVLLFSGIIIGILTLFQISKFSILSGGLAIEVIISIIALSSFFIGYYYYKKFSSSAQKNVERVIDHQKIKALEITKREYEVLELIAKGLSNKEVGEKLFLSESTIKSHVSNLLVKLNAKRRTQAIQTAKDCNILY